MTAEENVVRSLVLVLLALCGPGGATITSQVMKGCTRGLPPACSVTCSVSSRLCLACCAALATFTQAPTSNTTATAAAAATTAATAPVDLEGEVQTALDKLARCVSPCVKYTVSELKKILDERPDADIAEVSKQLAKVSTRTETDWKAILGSGYVFTTLQLCEQGAIKC